MAFTSSARRILAVRDRKKEKALKKPIYMQRDEDRNADLRRAWDTVRTAQADLSAALDAMAAELNRRDYIEDVLANFVSVRKDVPPGFCPECTKDLDEDGYCFECRKRKQHQASLNDPAPL
jgi:hypothetical protein